MGTNLKNRFLNKYNFFKSVLKLFFCKKKLFNLDNLSKKNNVNEIFHDNLINEKYLIDENVIIKSNIPDLKGGVNEGDRKALYFLINKFPF